MERCAHGAAVREVHRDALARRDVQHERLGHERFFSTSVATFVGTKAARSWLPNALFGTSTALMSNDRCGASAGHGLPGSAGSGGRPPVTAGSAKRRGRRRAIRQRLQGRSAAGKDADDAPGSLAEAPADRVHVEVVARHCQRPSGSALRDQAEPLRDPVVDRVERACCAARPGWSGSAKRFSSQKRCPSTCRVSTPSLDVDRPDHERVAGIGQRQRRERVAVGVRAEEQRGIAVLREPVGPWLGAQVERRVGRRVLVDRPQRHLAEAAVDQAGGELRPRVVGILVGVDVHDRAGVDHGSRLGIVVGRAPRLDDQLADEAVAPVVDAVDVRVEEDVVELDVRDTSGTARTPRRRTRRPRARSRAAWSA